NPDHYETFATIFDKFTAENFHPSLISEKSRTKSTSNNVLISAKIRDYIKCSFC
ncbi:12933_t:CDS:1, partial [Funneliformis geosporum]